MKEELQRFETHVSASPQLQEKMANAIGDLNKIAALAQEEGFDVSFDDLKSDLIASVAEYRDSPKVKALVAAHPEAHRFYYKAVNSADLHSQVMAAAGDADKLVALATEQGFDLDAAELQAFLDGLADVTLTAELSDEELDSVAGGGLFGALAGAGAGFIGGFVGGVVTSLAEGNSMSSSFETGKDTALIGGATGLISGFFAPEP
ncbi:MAG: putative ribosomally synthesized peptide with nif11-like leader [Glaciecola sp.]|jgi:predicted ribosomally synthesized peptide with nif11-like leader